MKKTSTLFSVLLTVVILFSCSLPPTTPVTRQELMRTYLYNKYILDESPEELLYALNTRGEVIIEGKRNIPGKDYPIYIKLLATSEGLIVNEYDR